mgnify:CR=1 FL=1
MTTQFEGVGFTDHVVAAMPKDDFITAHLGLWGSLPDDQKIERLSQVHEICTGKVKLPPPSKDEVIDYEELDAE